jgi:hypothetical protein
MESTTRWQYLEARAHPWKRQLFLKNRKLLASIVYREMLDCQLTPDEAARRWDLPLDALREVVTYCQENQDLIAEEQGKDR